MQQNQRNLRNDPQSGPVNDAAGKLCRNHLIIQRRSCINHLHLVGRREPESPAQRGRSQQGERSSLRRQSGFCRHRYSQPTSLWETVTDKLHSKIKLCSFLLFHNDFSPFLHFGFKEPTSFLNSIFWSLSLTTLSHYDNHRDPKMD